LYFSSTNAWTVNVRRGCYFIATTSRILTQSDYVHLYSISTLWSGTRDDAARMWRRQVVVENENRRSINCPVMFDKLSSASGIPRFLFPGIGQSNCSIQLRVTTIRYTHTHTHTRVAFQLERPFTLIRVGSRVREFVARILLRKQKTHPSRTARTRFFDTFKFQFRRLYWLATAVFHLTV